jgi:hypothetical protein
VADGHVKLIYHSQTVDVVFPTLSNRLDFDVEMYHLRNAFYGVDFLLQIFVLRLRTDGTCLQRYQVSFRHSGFVTIHQVTAWPMIGRQSGLPFI